MTIHPMSLVDHAWLRMDNPANLIVVNSVVWTDEPIDADVIRSLLTARMVDHFPRFKQHPDAAHGLHRRGHWVDDPDFDLDRHVLEVTLDPPGDTAALQRYVGDQMHIPLDPTHPLWQVHLVSGYNGGSAVLFRIHHAVADGMALARVLLSLTDDRPDVGFADPVDDSHGQGLLARLGVVVNEGVDTLRHPSRVVGFGAAAVRDAARLAHIADLPVKTPSVLNAPVGLPKVVSWSRPLPLDVIKAIGSDAGCTVNDVMLAALAGAFRAYLIGRGEEPGDVPVLVPVDLRPPDQPLPRELGNEFGFFFVSLLAGIADPRERLLATHRHTEELKSSPEALVTIGVLAGMGAVPSPLEDFSVAFFVSKVSGLVTNVPGPRQPVYIAGQKVAGVIGWVPRGGDLTFGAAIFSYDGTVTVGMASDAGAIPDPHTLVAAFEAELEAMAGQPV
jgi:diacylglycerol O-acyltransferase